MKAMLLAGAAAAAVFAASGAHAATVGWYGAVDSGYHFPDTLQENVAIGNTAGGNSTATHWQTSPAAMGDLRIGYKFPGNFRAEVEGAYRNDPLKAIPFD